MHIKKRGQVTIFIILGILILFLVAGGYYFYSYTVEKKLEMEEERAKELALITSSVKMFVEGCLKSSAEEGLLIIGEKGGYFQLPALSTKEAYANAPFYIYDDNLLLPTLDSISLEIASFVERELPSCLGNFSSFVGFDITSEKEPEVFITLTDYSMITDLDYPLNIKKVGETRLESFRTEIPARLAQIYQVTKDFTTRQKEEEMLCLSCLAVLSFQNDLNISVVADEEATFLSIFDYQKRIKNQPLVFRFAIENE